MKTNLIMIWKRKDAPRKDTILGGKTETELTEATHSAGYSVHESHPMDHDSSSSGHTIALIRSGRDRQIVHSN